ncbi:MAG TPA: protein translocase SEC61 complex subunit gamma [Candidatus Nanoarchaeia archaeon]|nr:protein translocase SEC61 complex subunit gamma [Candidatus Nanoarchaeia archaeon]
MKKKIRNLNLFYKKCKRVWKTLKKPTKEEWQQIAKISAIGIGIIGLIGFIISLVMKQFVVF